MNAIDTAFALVIASLGGIIVFFVALGARAMYVEAHPNEMAQCTPSRRANITANTTQAQRRVVLGRIDAAYVVPFPMPVGWQQPALVAQQLPPDMAWDDELQGWAPPKPRRGPTREEIAAAVCTPSRYDVLTMQRQFSMTYDLAALSTPEVHVSELIELLTGEPEPEPEMPVPVTDWPTPAVVEPEETPVPVVVGWQAARFAALEIERGQP